MSTSDLEEELNRISASALRFKNELFRLCWYMRGAVTVDQLLHQYSYEERNIISQIAKENIELTKENQMPLL